MIPTKPKIFITGIQGLIGWNLFNYFKQRYPTTGFSRSRVPGSNLKGEWYEGLLEDYSRIDALLDRVQPTVVIHAQAMCNTDLCEIKPEKVRIVNVEATEALLRALDSRPAKFVYLSSEHVFSGRKGFYNERDVCDPISVYGKTKLQAEQKIQAHSHRHMIVRPGLMIGPSAQGSVGPKDFLLKRLRKNLPASYFFNEIRSPILAEPFCEAVEYFIAHDFEGIIHLAGPDKISRYELAKCIARDAGLDVVNIRRKSIDDDLAVPRIADCTLDSSLAVSQGWINHKIEIINTALENSG